MKIDDAVIKFAQLHRIRSMKDMEILQMMMMGINYHEMAERLGRAHNTIAKRVSNMIVNSGLNGREGIMAAIYQMGKE